MKRTTRKLSGPAKDRFLARFLRSEPALDDAAAERLIERGRAIFTSVRIRRDAFTTIARAGRPAAARDRTTPNTPPLKPHESARTTAEPAPPTQPPSPVTASPEQSGTQAAAAFDPYVVGLVPVYQREGRDGLISRLQAIGTAAQLREMAKVQKIVLPQDLRTGDHAADVLRTAIADAVARRIADRRAAAS